MRPEVRETCHGQILRQQRHHASQPEGKHPAVPEGAGSYQPLGLLLRRFLYKPLNREDIRADRIRTVQHITIPRGSVCRPDSHQHPFGCLRLHRPHHGAHCFEITAVGIGVARHHDHRFVRRNVFFEGEIGRRKGDGRESLAPDRFRDNVHAFTKLIRQKIDLGRIGRHRKVVGQPCLTDLPDNTPYHRLYAATRPLKHRQELFRPRIVGKRP